jgi:outer membrane receptor protein involved in Fe transport
MSCRLAPSWALLAGFFILTLASNPVAQQSQLASRGPRFLLAAWVPGREVDASAAPVLQRRVSLNLTSVTIDQALKELTKQAALEIWYSARVVPVDRSVSLHGQGITVAAALREILLDVPVDVSVTTGGGLALVQRFLAAMVPGADSGAVAGHVLDSGSRAPIAGAMVTMEGTRQSTLTDAGGRYRIAGLAAGTYTIGARYIGYRPASVRVTISAGKGAIADLTLAKSAQELDQVVVTGSIVPTEVKALPTPVSVITAGDIARMHSPNVQELMRQAVPTAVSWNLPNTPDQTPISVRGASSFDVGGAQVKVFVDGIEVADATRAAVNPNSIERIEVIRGPQAAAMYGSAAIGGVVQIFTKRGEASLARPRMEAQVGLGVLQTPYAELNGVLRQSYSGSVHGGGTDVTYNLGTAYSHTDDYVPWNERSAQSNTSVYGGMRFARGITTVDISGRYNVSDYGNVVNPELAQSGFVSWSKPRYLPTEDQYQSLGARISVAPTSWWSSSVTVGLDRQTFEFAQSQPRLTTPSDTLLQVFNSSLAKTSIAASTSLQGTFGPSWSASLTSGIDHYWLPANNFFAFRASNTTGSITVGPGGFISASRTMTTNSGYFTQAQLGFRDALFLTAALRAEQNTNFGDSLGTPLSPRLGFSYVQPLGQATLKLRGSWGRAIRAPSPGLRLAVSSGSSVGLANPELGPERQRGWDAGLDAELAGRGAISLTYFDQIAENLIQDVTLSGTPVRTFQYQNIGRVRNRGVEIEATVTEGPLQLRGQYGYVRARIEQLSPSYAGEQQVGDQAETIPRHTAGASLTVSPFKGTAVMGGLTYVGSFTNLDFLGYYQCLGGTGPCKNTTQALDRSYLIDYPAFAKVRISVDQQVTQLLAAFILIDNLTNHRSYELLNIQPLVGRVTTAGVRLRW